jgi:hypothetical protein
MNREISDILIRATYGLGALVTGFAGGWIAHHWKTKAKVVEYEHQKRIRRLKNTSSDEALDRASKVKDILVDLAKHNIADDKFREMLPLLTGAKQTIQLIVENNPLQKSNEEILGQLSYYATKVKYWILKDLMAEFERGGSDIQQKHYDILKNATTRLEQSEEYDDATISGLAEQKLITQAQMLSLMWISGAKIRFLPDMAAADFESLWDSFQKKLKKVQ